MSDPAPLFPLVTTTADVIPPQTFLRWALRREPNRAERRALNRPAVVRVVGAFEAARDETFRAAFAPKVNAWREATEPICKARATLNCALGADDFHEPPPRRPIPGRAEAEHDLEQARDDVREILRQTWAQGSEPLRALLSRLALAV